MSLNISVSKQQINQLQPYVQGVIQDFFHTIVKITQEEMQDKVPVDSGEMRDSISVKLKGDLEAEVGPTVPYAVYVAEGTRPHTIQPVNASALRFEVGGKIVFTRLIRHPGTKPHPFLQETAEATSQRIKSEWRNQF